MDFTLLVEKSLHGDQAAFSEIFNHTIHGVYRTLYLLTTDRDDLDDLVQTIYLELYRNLDQYDKTRSLQAWLYGITINQHKAFMRRTWRNSRTQAKHNSFAFQTQEPDFSATVTVQAHIASKLQALSYTSRQVIVLHYLQDLTHENISEILNIPIGTVKSRLHTALRQLRDLWREIADA